MNYTAVTKFELLVARLGFAVTRKLLSEKLGFSARGVEPFRDKINEKLVADPSITQKIDDVWRDVVFGGDRSVKLFKSISDVKLGLIDRFFTNSLAQMSPTSLHSFQEAYPFPVDEIALESCDSELVLCDYLIQEITPTRVVKCAILCNKAHYTKTEPVSRAQLSSSGQVAIPEGAELFCRKRVSTQCFHAIILDMSTNNVFVAVDVSALPSAEAGIEFNNLHSYLRDTVQANLVTDTNLFRAISHLYDEDDGGRIHSVSFVTDDGNTDFIKLPTLSSQSCIKEDNYHQAGENAASVLSKYKLTKLWDLGDVPVGVELNGRKAMLLGSGSLNKLTTHNCTKLTDNIYVLDKVLAHI
ncbi:hypothetical protein [Vibrio cyclitrophicus]|uniref:hypothetical protein n=1 Tax=Vibrio cyclitrophicus TaxID=47951 RepID=UPI00148E7DDA|nr:hypothetical protein [Vibrio cyclitrophicus]NOH19110.1 hypothetical protein [Vibrio cyclitrophicus]